MSRISRQMYVLTTARSSALYVSYISAAFRYVLFELTGCVRTGSSADPYPSTDGLEHGSQRDEYSRSRTFPALGILALLYLASCWIG